MNLEDQFLTDCLELRATYSLPWQAGLTGIAYNPELTGREIKSIMDLLDPEFKGKVACLTEMRDTVGLFMMGLGHDPSSLDEDAINEALDLIEEATERASSGPSPATSISTASAPATSSPAWPGRATSCSSTTPAPTSSSCSPKRAR